MNERREERSGEEKRGTETEERREEGLQSALILLPTRLSC
jgi:hypothetical protein